MWLCSESLEVLVDPLWGVRFNYASGKGETSDMVGEFGCRGEASAAAASSDPAVLTMV